ncbi:hypothetical protein [Paenibacillus sp. BAC0078]
MANKMLVDYGKLDFRNIAYASLEMIKQTVIGGAGIALVPKCSVEQELQTNQLQVFDFGQPIFINHGIIESKSAHRKESSEIFKRFIIKYFSTTT